jgi:hypothetical protein
MKRMKITLDVPGGEELFYSEEVEDRLSIILGMLGFHGKIENEITGNSTQIMDKFDSDKQQCSEFSWVDGNVKIKRQIFPGSISRPVKLH